MTVRSVKVNRPRLSLRRNGGKRTLKHQYRGVVPMLIRLGVPPTRFFKASPEGLTTLVGIFLSESSYLGLNEVQLTTLRRYIKKHNLEDWTRREDEPSKCDSTIADARGRKNKRKL